MSAPPPLDQFSNNARRLPADNADLWEIATEALRRLYGGTEILSSIMAEITARVDAACRARPEPLKALDKARSDNRHWYVRQGRPAYCTYIDRFAGTLNATERHLDYLQDLNVGLFHPLPLLKPREGNSDGGFAVADFRDVDPRLGTFADLEHLAGALRERDMSLVLDVVCNHTAEEHPWAKGQLSGDPRFKDFYIILKTEAEVAEWELALQDVFPDTAPGSFTHVPEAGGWVWTTFYPFQWDLNYANPKVFIEMMDVLFYLANAGVEGFRLDSAPFLWKQKGTISRNLGQTHDIVRAWRALLSIVAPSVFLLAEAIESVDDVLPFLGSPEARECDMAYNNVVMTALWGALAEQKVDVLRAALQKAAKKPAHGHWLNYVRCHDDIIWLALDDLASEERLKSWSDFYVGHGPYAKGMAFQAPPGRPLSTCGMAASLTGFGQDPLGLARLKLLYGVTYALDGVPLIYMGDEIALENDESFLDDADRKAELRWLHRPDMDWNAVDDCLISWSGGGEMYIWLKKLSLTLQGLPELVPGLPIQFVQTTEPGLLWFERRLAGRGRLICLANFTERSIALTAIPSDEVLIGDITNGRLSPYGLCWLLARD